MDAKPIAEAIYREVLSQISADRLVAENLRRAGDICFIQDEPFDLKHFSRVRVAGAGKASAAMAAAVAKVLDVSDGLVISKEPFATRLFEVIEAGHPVPDESSLQAGQRMLEFARSCTATDLVIFCLSGGASALMEVLVDGVSLADLQTTTELLLASGAPIQTINAVRRQLSRVKAGRLGSAFGDATVVVLVLSDVVSNDLSVIGSGPLFPASERAESGHAKLAHSWALAHENALPEAVKTALTDFRLRLRVPRRKHVVIGSPALLAPLAAEAARKYGLEPMIYADPLQGEARLRAHRIVKLAKSKVAQGQRNFCMIFAGETTVTLRHSGPSKGGRCQEMALAAAVGLRDAPDLAFLAAGTDGSDGPTDAAGGLVDHLTAAKTTASLRQALATNGSYDWLRSADALLKTGPTSSNLTDLVLVVQKS